MLTCLLAPHVPRAARALALARTLDDLDVGDGAPVGRPPASGPAAVALTFDDGPHPDGTPRILELLAEHHARATFFLVGEQVQRRPELAARIVAAGHAVALHGYRHRAHPLRSTRALGRDFDRGLAAIADAAGVMPRAHRPPYGLYSPASLTIARQRGLQPILWSRWGRDWRKLTTPERIARRVLSRLAPGDVILLHDADFYSASGSYLHTAAALPEILTTLAAAELGTVVIA